MTLVAELRLEGGEIAFLDDEDLDLVLATSPHWYARPVYTDHHHHIPICTDPNHNHVYVVSNVIEGGEKKIIRLHRLITGFDSVIFADYNGLNNKRSNLEPSGSSQLAMSSPKKTFKNRKSTSKYKGVSWNKSMAKWKATIYLNNKATNLGYYTSEVEAAKEYDKAAKELFGEYACPNFTEKTNNGNVRFLQN